MDLRNESSVDETVTESIFHLDSDGGFTVTPEIKKSYQDNGFIIIRQILDKQEVDLIEKGWTADPAVTAKRFSSLDDRGDEMLMALWGRASSDATGLYSRSQKLAGTIEKLLGDEVYHYHAKYLCKPPQTGGSFIWHQDYGYWYTYGNLFPDDMCTALLAVDDMSLDNGCLKIIPGSHKAGRVDHTNYTYQYQADIERVELYIQRLGIRQVILNKGDVIIFHSNILHRSDKNESDRRRLALAVAFNTKRNNPTKKHHHPCYTKMEKVENTALIEWGEKMEWDATKVVYNPRDNSDATIDHDK